MLPSNSPASLTESTPKLISALPALASCSVTMPPTFSKAPRTIDDQPVNEPSEFLVFLAKSPVALSALFIALTYASTPSATSFTPASDIAIVYLPLPRLALRFLVLLMRMNRFDFVYRLVVSDYPRLVIWRQVTKCRPVVPSPPCRLTIVECAIILHAPLRCAPLPNRPSPERGRETWHGRTRFAPPAPWCVQKSRRAASRYRHWMAQ